MANQQGCPFEFFKKGVNIGIQLIAIEKHLAAPGPCIHLPLKELLLKTTFNSYTSLLLLACAEGDLVAVKRIIEHWGLDVGATATYYPLDDSLSPSFVKATPLFVAAFNGHSEVVRYLVAKGASISARTEFSSNIYGGMTPLYGALISIENKLKLDIDWLAHVASPKREKKTDAVRFLLESGANPSAMHKCKFPAWMTNLGCSNTTTIKALIDHGMRLDQRNPYDCSTVLHHWASNPFSTLLEIRSEDESPLVVVKLLVEKGCDLMAIDTNGFSPILKAAHNLLADTSQENFSILEFLLKKDVISRQEKIDALELIGAVILSDHRNAHLFQNAFDYWRRALHLREMKTVGSGPIYKTAMKRKSGLTVEWVTSTQLEDVKQNQSEYLLQSFLVRFRIYFNKSWKAFTDFLTKLIEKELPLLIRKFKEENKLAELVNILWAVLDMIVSLKSQELEHTWKTTAKIIEAIVNILSSILEDHQILTTKTIKVSLELIVCTEKLHLKTISYRQSIDDHMRTLFKLVKKLAVLPDDKLSVEITALLAALVQLERPASRDKQTLLHMACSDIGNNLNTIPLLLEAGADPNAGNSVGDGPLHVVLAYFHSNKMEDYEIVRTLVAYGAHLDRVNNNRKTAVDLWNLTKYRANQPRLSRGLPPARVDRLPDWCIETVPKLSCLSARIIRSRNLFYSAKTLPIHLHKFVKMH